MGLVIRMETPVALTGSPCVAYPASTLILGRDVKVGAAQRVSVLAVRLAVSRYVRPVRQRFDVLHIDAKFYFATVMKFVSRWNGSHVTFIDVAVGLHMDAVTLDDAIPVPAGLASPDVTGRREWPRGDIELRPRVNAPGPMAADEAHGPTLDVAAVAVRALGDRRGIAAPTLAETVRGHGAGV